MCRNGSWNKNHKSVHDLEKIVLGRKNMSADSPAVAFRRVLWPRGQQTHPRASLALPIHLG